MGHGIAQVAAAAGFDVRLYDLEPAFVERGLERVRANLRKGVERGKLDQAAADAALGRLVATTDLDEACGGADLVVEATPEVLELKRDLFRRIAALAPPDAVLASNTSSLGIGDIAQAVPEPGGLCVLSNVLPRRPAPTMQYGIPAATGGMLFRVTSHAKTGSLW
jgi:3-hydroxyacyl-CoA dehydrogenase